MEQAHQGHKQILIDTNIMLRFKKATKSSLVSILLGWHSLAQKRFHPNVLEQDFHIGQVAYRCRFVGRAGFVFRFLQFSNDFARLNRQDTHSDTAMGLKQSRITVLHGSHRWAID